VRHEPAPDDAAQANWYRSPRGAEFSQPSARRPPSASAICA